MIKEMRGKERKRACWVVRRARQLTGAGHQQQQSAQQLAFSSCCRHAALRLPVRTALRGTSRELTAVPEIKFRLSAVRVCEM